MWWTLLWLASCGGTPEEAPPAGPTSRGLVLFVEPEALIVQHDDTLGRLNPGVEFYPAPPELLREVRPGQSVDLWLSRMSPGGRQVEDLKVTGSPGLSEDHVAEGYPLTGMVLRVDVPELTLDHEAIEGVMDSMVMPFRVGSRALQFRPGDEISARLLPSPYGWTLAEMKKTGEGDSALRADIPPLQIGETLPRTAFIAEDGTEQILGEGQPKPTLLTFIYTRCPDPTFCPALVSRLLSLQAQLGEEARLVTLTLDPDYDTPEVLATYGEGVGADPTRWRLGRMEPAALHALALRAGLAVTEREGRIAHLIRVLILDAEGNLVERYDDNRWPLERVLQQLNTGEPRAEQAGTQTR